MKDSDVKALKAITATEKFLKEAKAKGFTEEFTKGVSGSGSGGLTIIGCEKRNLEEYVEILGKDKRKLTGRLRELYFAI